jgi:hypothetical protein
MSEVREHSPDFQHTLQINSLQEIDVLTNYMELSTIRETTNARPLHSFPAFHGTRRFNTEFTTALHLFLS